MSASILSFRDVLTKFRKEAFSERDKGTKFERLMKSYLQIAPEYEGKFKEIWLWDEFPFRNDFSGKDTGIDLVAQTVEGDYWAIQCKCYDEKSRINKDGVDSFLATSSKEFCNDKMETQRFEYRLWISTTNNWNSEAERTIRNQNPPVLRISLSDLDNAPIDWEKLINGDGKALKAKYPLREHQKLAVEKTHKYFETSDRGKLIMACGTGKTFTSLKIAENETNSQGLVLFLVPSIALLGQTLREWMSQSDKPIHPICICSDSKITQDDDGNGSVVDLALPASTDVESIRRQLYAAKLAQKNNSGMIVVFSTYQSIDVISAAQKKINAQEKGAFVFDLVVCDEAHRTTGVILSDKAEAAFTKIHDNEIVVAKKRLYMTATPRLYTDASKQKAQEGNAVLCSMDDTNIYGEEIYRIGFGEAVKKDLLSDYKVLILTIREDQIPVALQNVIKDKNNEIDTDDASKLIGCINALSKRVLDTDESFNDDKKAMHTAVAFCQSIKISKKISNMFNEHKDTYYDSLTQEERAKLVGVSADHIDGSMGASERAEKLSWLKNVSQDSQDCHILCNVKCLSEGVDVPSLDAVMFLSAKNSQVDVVQSVGRVMRKSKTTDKKYGYIIIPIVVPADIEPEQALDDNERYKVVWSVLNALRSHDDRFDAEINQIDLNKKKGNRVRVIGLDDGTKPANNGEDAPKQLSLPYLEKLQDAMFAKMVKKVGNRQYWVQWANDVAHIAERYIERINHLIVTDEKHRKEFDKFLKGVRKNINPSISEDSVVQMLAQHLITQPVFEALFENYSFVANNPVSKSLQRMIDLLEKQSFDKDAEILGKFYESVKERVQGIDNAAGKQKVIVELYDKFFKTAFPKTVEQLGIVYTPVEVVDFINQSVAKVLKKEFNRNLSDENIHILDPFTGTGTFITRMIQQGLIDKEVLPRKYAKELHANEIVLLAYYIASINIENAYHDAVGLDDGYKSFNGICLTDTFQLGETDNADDLFTDMLPQNSARVIEQKKAPVRIIIGNPPYSAGQKSANDNAQNQKYPKLDARVADTYAKYSTATNKNALYDSYIKAFRWSSDRITDKDGGIVAFITNSGWIDSNAMGGFRKCLEDEYDAVYVFNLRGAIRGKSKDLSQKEGQNVFDIMTGVAITILVKNPKRHQEKASIYYHDIGDYLKRSEKLGILNSFKDISNSKIDWKILKPNEHNDWLNQRSDLFSSFIPMGDKDDKTNTKTVFAPYYSRGLATTRDAWCYNSSKTELENNIRHTIDFYNNQREQFSQYKQEVKKHISYSAVNISWSDGLIDKLKRNDNILFNEKYIFESIYRPFFKQQLYYNRDLNERVYQQPKAYPTSEYHNLSICVSGIGSNKKFSSFIVNKVPCLDMVEKSQCFPLYYYDKNEGNIGTLFDQGKENYTRRDGITDFILGQCRERYGFKVQKEDIFYYVYGLLHSPDYREQFAADLKKMLPRIPLVEVPADFWAFSKAGRALAELHLNYETVAPYPDAKVIGAESGKFRVEKMKFAKIGKAEDKTTLIYNSYIRIENIPLEAYDYVVNGRSAIEWIMDRYQVKIDKDSQIKNDPNDWCDEHNNPRYILDLILSLITVSIETMKIVKSLPKLEFR